MKLIVFPGGSDSNHEEYNQVYSLIKQHAPKFGYNECIIPTYPGHDSHHQKREITLSSSVKITRQHIDKLEQQKELYRVVCRSFGCFPFVEVIKEVQTNFLAKAILWGVPPYYLYFKVSVEDFDENFQKSRDRGVNPSKTLFQEVYPIELSIQKLQNIEFELVVCSGSLDKFFPEHFRQTLIEMIKKNNSSKIYIHEAIEGLDHAVKKYNEDYLNLLLN